MLESEICYPNSLIFPRVHDAVTYVATTSYAEWFMVSRKSSEKNKLSLEILYSRAERNKCNPNYNQIT